MIPSSRPKLSDLYTISKSKLLENHTLHSGTYPYSPYMAVTPRVDSRIITGDTSVEIFKCSLTHSPLNRPEPPVPIQVLSTLCDVISFNGQGQN